MRMSQAQQAAWRALERCPDCRAGEEPLPGTEHARLWQVVSVQWIRDRAKHRKEQTVDDEVILSDDLSDKQYDAEFVGDEDDTVLVTDEHLEEMAALIRATGMDPDDAAAIVLSGVRERAW